MEEAVISFKNYMKGLEFSVTKVAYQSRAYTIGALQKLNQLLKGQKKLSYCVLSPITREQLLGALR